MRISACLLVMMAATTPVFAQQDSVPTASAYLDATAGTLVKLARERRMVADLSVDAYKALSKERISVGLRGLRRDRLLYRREVAGRIQWTRGGQGKIEVLGAREAVPVAIKNVQLPSDLYSFMPHLAFDPADNEMLLGWGDNDFIRHPLAVGSERYYQFKTGATTSIQLPDGKIVRLIELDIIPRVANSHNVAGSFWLEAETHAVVQAAFRLARDIDILRDTDDDDDDKKDIPGFMKPMTFSIDYVTLEYGLYDLKWWMPRSILFEGTMRAGFLRAPMQYERTYSGYEIHASEHPVLSTMAEVKRQDSVRIASRDSCEKRTHVNVSVRVGGDKNTGATHPDSVIVQNCGRWEVTMSTDTAALLNSAELPSNVFGSGEELVTEGELRELQKRVEKLGGGPSMLPVPITDFDALAISQMRYNRVEGLSIGTRGSVDYGAYRATASARIGIADRIPNAELSIERPGKNTSLRVAGYKRLNAFDPAARPFSTGASLSSLLFGRDEAFYYRTAGAELVVEPNGARTHWYTVRMFAQHEGPASKKTNFSARHLFSSSYDFQPNIPATRGNEYGSEVTLHFNHGLDPDAFRFGGDVYAHGAKGTNDFGRSAVTLRTAFPLPSAFNGALEGAAGLTSNGAPLQHLWYLGGSSTLRGYNVGVLSGDAFWRGRAEIGYGLPAVRLVGFTDAGWAGSRKDFSAGKPLIGVGAGASFLDGILRFDIARGIKAPKGWTASFYFDAAL